MQQIPPILIVQIRLGIKIQGELTTHKYENLSQE